MEINVNFLVLDIATGVGFYAVSIPFFDKDNKLLQDNKDGERLRVRFGDFFTFFRKLKSLLKFAALLHFRSHVGQVG